MYVQELLILLLKCTCINAFLKIQINLFLFSGPCLYLIKTFESTFSQCNFFEIRIIFTDACSSFEVSIDATETGWLIKCQVLACGHFFTFHFSLFMFCSAIIFFKKNILSMCPSLDQREKSLSNIRDFSQVNTIEEHINQGVPTLAALRFCRLQLHNSATSMAEVEILGLKSTILICQVWRPLI